MYNDDKLEERWNQLVANLTERTPQRYANTKTYDGDPRGNYNVSGDFDKLAPGETPSDYYSQGEDGDSNDSHVPMGYPDHAVERDTDGWQRDGRHELEIEHALKDAMDSIGQADPAEVYDKLTALRDMLNEI